MNEEYKYPKPDRSRWGRFRDLIAYHIAVFVFDRIATPWYRAMIGGSIQLGLKTAREEARAERAVPSEKLIPSKKEFRNE